MVPAVQVGDVVDYHYYAFFGNEELTSTEAVVTAVYDARVGHVQLRYNVSNGYRTEPKRISTMHSTEPVAHSWTRVVRSAQQIAAEAAPAAPEAKSKVQPESVVEDTMATLKKHRVLLIRQAQSIATELAKTKGVVTSTDVFREMERRGVDTTGHDKRWMGAVFSSKDWALVDYTPQGSHGRRISVWALK